MSVTQETAVFNVLSLDPERIRVEETGNGLIVCKKTSMLEYRQIREAKSWLRANTATLTFEGSAYRVVLPKDVIWIEERNELQTSFCAGRNFEMEIVRSPLSERARHVAFAKAFISWMRESRFLWKGSAPRNILIDHARRMVSIVDFERSLFLGGNVSDQEFDFFLVGTVHEEFSCFFLRDEIVELFPTIWNWPKNGKLVEVTSSRQCRLIKTVYGITSSRVSDSVYSKTARMMSDAAMPFLLGEGQVFYPAYALEELNGGQGYVNAVLDLLREPESERPGVLRHHLRIR